MEQPYYMVVALVEVCVFNVFFFFVSLKLITSSSAAVCLLVVFKSGRNTSIQQQMEVQ